MPTAPTDLRALLDAAQDRTVLILGDLMLDHFVIGRVDRISPEAPVPVVQFDHESYRLRGAPPTWRTTAPRSADAWRSPASSATTPKARGSSANCAKPASGRARSSPT